jgi:hypothetical protein
MYSKSDRSQPSLHTYCTSIPASSDKPLLSSLFVKKMILDLRERSLQHAHLSLSCLLCQHCLAFLLISTCQCQRTKDVLAQFIQVIPLHVSKSQVDATLCPCQQKNILQLLIYIPELHNLTVVDQPWNVKKCNCYCPIQTKEKYGGDIVVIRPSIAVTFLYISIPCLLQIKLEAVHCCPAVHKKWVLHCKGFFK